MTLPGKVQTEIVQERVALDRKRSWATFQQIKAEGGMVGNIPMSGPQRLQRYWLLTPNLADLQLLADPNAEQMIRAGLAPGPVNPFWINQLRVPGQFTELARDFMRLNAQHETGGGNEVRGQTLPSS